MKKPVRKYLTTEEVERLLVRTSDPTDRLLIQLGLTIGCRVSEVLSIKLISISGRVVEIWDEKKDEYRHGVIAKGTAEALADYLTNHYQAPTGVRKDFQTLFHFSGKTVNRRVKKWFEVADVSREVPWRWHTLRHTYVRRMLDAMKDRSIQFICEQTGDSPQTILKYYGVPSLEERLQVAEDYPITNERPRGDLND